MKVNLYGIKDEKIHLTESDCRDFKLSEKAIVGYMNKKTKKIEMNAIDAFLLDIKCKGFTKGEELVRVFKRSRFRLQFFLYDKSVKSDPEWMWVAANFLKKKIKYSNNPKAILLITYKMKSFAYTFGSSFFLADKYCDREMAFDFARKIEYKDIKLVSKVAPYSKNNKTIDAFTESDVLIFDSGEAFTKIKGKVKIKGDFNVFKQDIEIGTSLKLSLFENSIENLLNIIVYVQEVLTTKGDKTPIPLLKRVLPKERKLIDSLNKKLIDTIKKGKMNISLSEFEIKGTTEFFYSSPDSFQIGSGSDSLSLDTLDASKIKKFILDRKIEDEKILDLEILVKKNEKVEHLKLIELIDYSDDSNKCVLISGKWYKFNLDYQTYLQNSLNEIDVRYDSKFNFSRKEHNRFIEKKASEEKQLPENSMLSEKDLIKKIGKKFYRERYFNISVAEKNEMFDNYDRGIDETGVGKIEIADLYYKDTNEQTIYAVKMGSGSSDLSYVVAQSEASLEIYKNDILHEKIETLPIRNVGIWIVLKRKKKLSELNGKINLNDLDMFILKNRLDEWKKKVRLLGFNPVIRINYFED